MTFKRLIASAAIALSLAASPAVAADSYKFDTAHTQILFKVSHLGFSFSHGKFLKFDGGFTFDPAKVEDSTVDVTIDTASIDMDHDKWDEHMKSADLLNVAKVPAMTFKSTGIEKTGEKTGKLTGDLTLLGVTKPVTLDVTWNGSGVHPYSQKTVAGFSATGTLKRSDFGMAYGLPGVGDDVAIMIEVEGEKEEPAKVNN